MKTEVLQQRIAWDVSVTKMKQMQNWQTVENYRTADNRNYDDGDLKSRISADVDWKSSENDRGTNDMYYNDGKGEITTMIDDEARVYKGGSWKDKAYWLNPGSRRYMNQKRASNDIGFRCAMSHVGNATGGKGNKVKLK